MAALHRLAPHAGCRKALAAARSGVKGQWRQGEAWPADRTPSWGRSYSPALCLALCWLQEGSSLADHTDLRTKGTNTAGAIHPVHGEVLNPKGSQLQGSHEPGGLRVPAQPRPGA
ncbi:hypothetical protein H8959_015977 [Pygathrix nigripes]